MGAQVGLAREHLVADGTRRLAAVQAHVVCERVAERERAPALGAHVLLRLGGALLRRRRQRHTELETYSSGRADNSVTNQPGMREKWRSCSFSPIQGKVVEDLYAIASLPKDRNDRQIPNEAQSSLPRKERELTNNASICLLTMQSQPAT